MSPPSSPDPASCTHAGCRPGRTAVPARGWGRRLVSEDDANEEAIADRDAAIAQRDIRPTTDQLAAVEAERDARFTEDQIRALSSDYTFDLSPAVNVQMQFNLFSPSDLTTFVTLTVNP